uniref:hypothetical protein n=1 Tax=Nocardia asiatica TaxID=209252 RepID=UPI002454537E
MNIGPHEEDRVIAEASARFDRGTDRSGPDALIRMGLELALVLVEAAAAPGSRAQGRVEPPAAPCAPAGHPHETRAPVQRARV